MDNILTLEAKIEAILFYKSEAISIKKLATMLGASVDEINAALISFESSLQNRGVRLMRISDEVRLATAPEASTLIETLVREELSRDISKAGLETLSIILYKGPITRSQIDYIRGVNSTFIIRNLLVRGLIEKIQNEKDSRSFLYKPTFDLLSHLGISRVEDLPNYGDNSKAVESFLESDLSNEGN